MKSEEKSIRAISAQAHGESADNRLLRKKLLARVIFSTRISLLQRKALAD